MEITEEWPGNILPFVGSTLYTQFIYYACCIAMPKCGTSYAFSLGSSKRLQRAASRSWLAEVRGGCTKHEKSFSMAQWRCAVNRLVIGGLLAIALLGLFVYGVVVALNTARAQAPVPPLSDGTMLILETIGALVSAVVISELAVTKPKEAPGTRLADALTEYSAGQKRAVQVLASIYILVWLISGLALLVIGLVQHPTVAQVNSAAKEWLGVAVAAAYAYFGISR